MLSLFQFRKLRGMRPRPDKSILREMMHHRYDAIRRGTHIRIRHSLSPALQKHVEDALHSARKRIFQR